MDFLAKTTLLSFVVCLKDKKYSPAFNCFSGTATKSPMLSLFVTAITSELEIISILEFGIPLPAITRLPSGFTLTTSNLIVSAVSSLVFLTSMGLASITLFTKGTTTSFSSTVSVS